MGTESRCDVSKIIVFEWVTLPIGKAGGGQDEFAVGLQCIMLKITIVFDNDIIFQANNNPSVLKFVLN